MSKKLFVGNLPFSTTEEALHAMFKAHGEVVSANLITDKNSGQSRGFGFVEMSSDAEAAAAIEKMNGTPVDGRNIIVNEAKPKEKSSGNKRFSKGFKGNKSRGGYSGGDRFNKY
ncbi:MAG: RNA-binding protein [bacterium]